MRWETWPAFVPNINDSSGNLDGREVFDHARRLAWVVYDNFDTRKSVPRDGPAPHGGFHWLCGTCRMPRYAVVTQEPKGTIDVKKATAEQKLPMRRQAFRLRVGSRCDWQCVVTGTGVKGVVDAAHPPSKNWRIDNQSGVLIRTDLPQHRAGIRPAPHEEVVG